MATQNLTPVSSQVFPQPTLCFNCGKFLSEHSGSQNWCVRNGTETFLTFKPFPVADKTLPFLTDGFVERCIAVTDRNLKFTWHDQEEFLYGAL